MPARSEPTTDQRESAEQPRGASKGRSLGTAKNMVISMVAVLLGCAIWLWMTPQNSEPTKPVKNVPSIAREVSKQQKWDLALPQGLGKKWVPVNVRLVRIQGQPPTWHAAYKNPDGDFVSAEQTKNGDAGWVRNQTQGGEPAGKTTVEDASWTRYEAGEVRSLVRSKPLAGLDTIVTGKVEWDVLQRYAAALKPRPAAR